VFPVERLLDPDSVPGLYLAVVGLPLLVVVRGRARGWLVAGLAVAACLVQAWRAQAGDGLLDLDIYVGAAESWLRGGSVYAYRDPTFGLGSTYPPVAAVAFAPLVPLGEAARALLWTAANLAALALTCRLVATRLLGFCGERATTWTLVATGLAAVTVPVWISIAYQGQVNVVLWLLVVADVATLAPHGPTGAARRSRWTGVGIGVATALKLVPGLFVLWLLAIGERRGALRAVAVAAGATALGAVLAPGDSWRYWTDLLWDSSRVGDVADVQNNSLLAVVARALPEGPARTATWLVLAAVVAAVGLWRGRVAVRAGDLLTATVVVGCASSLVSPISWTHHLGFLVLALAALAGRRDRPPRWGWLVAAWVALLDPIGFGTDATTSGVRTAAMVALVVWMPVVPGRSRPDHDDPSLDAAAPGRAGA
jgi:alpha-1,2-mannosyltransferase